MSRALAVLSASISSWPGSEMCSGVRAVPVEDGGDLVGAADAAGGALAELGAGLGVDPDLGHGE